MEVIPMRKAPSWAWVGLLILFLGSLSRAQQPGDEVPGASDSNTLASGTAPTAPVNVNAVAILRWYPANLTTTFAVGIAPSGVAFDGANIWVTDPSLRGGTVSKL